MVAGEAAVLGCLLFVADPTRNARLGERADPAVRPTKAGQVFEAVVEQRIREVIRFDLECDGDDPLLAARQTADVALELGAVGAWRTLEVLSLRPVESA